MHYDDGRCGDAVVAITTYVGHELSANANFQVIIHPTNHKDTQIHARYLSHDLESAQDGQQSA